MARFAAGCLPYPFSFLSSQSNNAQVQVPSQVNHQAKRMLPAVGAVIVLFVSAALGQASISAADAKNHIGEKATVCGRVASTHFAANSRGKPTFINLDEPYPNQIFTVVIWGSDRSNFGDPESAYRNKHICVSGVIESYRGVPQIVARESQQILSQEK